MTAKERWQRAGAESLALGMHLLTVVSLGVAFACGLAFGVRWLDGLDRRSVDPLPNLGATVCDEAMTFCGTAWAQFIIDGAWWACDDKRCVRVAAGLGHEFTNVIREGAR